jgi:hypothetical protein
MAIISFGNGRKNNSTCCDVELLCLLQVFLFISKCCGFYCNEDALMKSSSWDIKNVWTLRIYRGNMRTKEVCGG